MNRPVTARAPSLLTLERHQVAELRRLAELSYPYEACGFLVGRRRAARSTPRVDVREVLHGRNLDASDRTSATPRRPDRYRLDPEEVLAVDRTARARRLELVGFWHSHPDGPPEPSARDLETLWPDRSYLIVSIDALGSTALRSFRSTGRGLGAEPIALT
ncbi:MAG: M67 family metallopeptidase [Acidobacteriota bacterium]